MMADDLGIYGDSRRSSLGQPSGGQSSGARASGGRVGPGRSAWKGVTVGLLIAFLCGLALMAGLLTRWNVARGWIGLPALGAASVPAVTPAAPAPAAPPAAISPGQAEVIDMRVAQLEDRIARLDLRAAAAAANASRAESLLVAFAARRAIDRGVQLGYLEPLLSERFGASQPRAVALVIAASQNPVTLAQLQFKLSILTPQLAASSSPQDDWGDRVMTTLGQLIVVRRASSPAPAPDQRVMRAENALAGGNVQGALIEVARLPNAALANNWQDAAKRYIEAQHALDMLEAAALNPPVSPIGGAAPGTAQGMTQGAVIKVTPAAPPGAAPPGTAPPGTVPAAAPPPAAATKG